MANGLYEGQALRTRLIELRKNSARCLRTRHELGPSICDGLLIMLLLAVVAIAPGVSIVAGLLLMIPAFQMIAGQPAPVFPRRIAAHPLPTRHLAALVQRAVPVLRYLEKAIHPRWHTPLEATKRVVGIVVVILNTTLVFTPIPLSNVVPASCDRPDLVGLSRGRRTPALDRLICRRHRGDNRIDGRLADSARREMDLWTWHTDLDLNQLGIITKHDRIF